METALNKAAETVGAAISVPRVAWGGHDQVQMTRVHDRYIIRAILV